MRSGKTAAAAATSTQHFAGKTGDYIIECR